VCNYLVIHKGITLEVEQFKMPDVQLCIIYSSKNCYIPRFIPLIREVCWAVFNVY